VCDEEEGAHVTTRIFAFAILLLAAWPAAAQDTTRGRAVRPGLPAAAQPAGTSAAPSADQKNAPAMEAAEKQAEAARKRGEAQLARREREMQRVMRGICTGC
jgi:hypothetical protein